MISKSRLVQNFNGWMLFFSAFLFGFFGARVSPAFAVPPGYNLVWNDEFNQRYSTGLNTDDWEYIRRGDGFGNHELETYTDDPANVAIFLDPAAMDHLTLVIRALQQGGGYTSGRIDTKGHKSFQYGYIEARIRLPYGQGIWPAFWMLGDNNLGWPNCGEIDIMENIGNKLDQGTTHGSIHGPGYSAGHCLGDKYVLPNGGLFKDAYHLFAVEWEKDSIKFYCDNQLYETRAPADLPPKTEWVFNHSFFIILNLAVGGDWPKGPDATTTFPQAMKVDYVRVYQKGAPATPVVSKAPGTVKPSTGSETH